MAAILAFDAKPVMSLLIDHDAAKFGAAMGLIVASAAGVPVHRPHVLLGLSRPRWENMRFEVYSLIEQIMEHSEVRVRLGRRPLPDALRQQILERDGEECRWCGVTEGPWHIDHILAVIRGGSDDPENLCVSCVPCNLSKGAKLVEDWLG